MESDIAARAKQKASLGIILEDMLDIVKPHDEIIQVGKRKWVDRAVHARRKHRPSSVGYSYFGDAERYLRPYPRGKKGDIEVGCGWWRISRKA